MRRAESNTGYSESDIIAVHGETWPPTQAQLVKLRRASRNTMASLPPEARRVLDHCNVYVADLGGVDGRQIQGAARDDGHVVLIDRGAIEELSVADLENLLAHELGHAYRQRLGIADAGEREKLETRKVVKSWGLREKGRR